jgi:hypothetical protein
MILVRIIKSIKHLDRDEIGTYPNSIPVIRSLI